MMYAAHKHVDPRPVGPEGWWCWLLLISPPTHQNNIHKQITPSLNNYHKPSIFPKLGHMVEGISLLLPGKALKLLFSTSPQILSPRFDLALEWVFSISFLKILQNQLLGTIFTWPSSFHFQEEHDVIAGVLAAISWMWRYGDSRGMI